MESPINTLSSLSLSLFLSLSLSISRSLSLSLSLCLSLSLSVSLSVSLSASLSLHLSHLSILSLNAPITASEYLLRFASTWSLTFALPFSQLFLSFLRLSPSHQPCYRIPFCHIYSHLLSFLHPSSHQMYFSPLPCSLPPSLLSLSPRHIPTCHVFCRSFSNVFPCNHLPSPQSPILILLVTTLLLSTFLPLVALSFTRLCGESHLYSLHNIASLAIAGVRKSTCQHPSSIDTAQDFPHPDNDKSTKLCQWSLLTVLTSLCWFRVRYNIIFRVCSIIYQAISCKHCIYTHYLLPVETSSASIA